MSMDRRLYWIWLQRHLPLGSMATNRLSDHFSDIEAVFAAKPAALREVELRPQEYLELQDKDLTEAKGILKAMQDIGGWVLTPEDVCYPEALREIDGFPAVLYGEGTMPQLNRMPSVAVVGTRYATEEGKDNAYMLAGGLAAAGMVVVSGGARGIDAAAHAGALDAQGVTVLVKAAPPEVEYPQGTAALRRHILEAGGAIVTEYAPGKPFFCDYHVRNRLMVGMTLGTCVVEAPQRSGALISANLARAQGEGSVCRAVLHPQHEKCRLAGAYPQGRCPGDACGGAFGGICRSLCGHAGHRCRRKGGKGAFAPDGAAPAKGHEGRCAAPSAAEKQNGGERTEGGGRHADCRSSRHRFTAGAAAFRRHPTRAVPRRSFGKKGGIADFRNAGAFDRAGAVWLCQEHGGSTILQNMKGDEASCPSS